MASNLDAKTGAAGVHAGVQTHARALSVRGVRHSYGAQLILNGIDLEVEAGGLTVLTGPSGCGKSTLLRMIAGLERPDSGEVYIGGRPATGRPGEAGLVFQEGGLYPWLTVRGNVAFGLKLQGRQRREISSRVAELLELVNLSEAADAYPAQLSGGMAQRVGLARALAPRPRVLLLDEPFGAVDAQLRNMLQEELVRIWAESGTTMVFVTHNIDEAVFVGERIVVMSSVPSVITNELEVGLPHPRVRTSPEFVRRRERVLGWLTEARA